MFNGRKCLRVDLSRNAVLLLAFSSIIAFCFSKKENRIIKAIQKQSLSVNQYVLEMPFFSDVKYDGNVPNYSFDLALIIC